MQFCNTVIYLFIDSEFRNNFFQIGRIDEFQKFNAHWGTTELLKIFSDKIMGAF